MATVSLLIADRNALRWAKDRPLLRVVHLCFLGGKKINGTFCGPAGAHSDKSDYTGVRVARARRSVNLIRTKNYCHFVWKGAHN